MVSYFQASVISTTLYTILFGIYIGTFFYCLRWLIFNDESWTKRTNIEWKILTVTFAIFALSTADLGFTLNGTILSSTSGNSFHSSSVQLLIVECLTTIIIDSVLICRCWIVYKKSWRIVSGPLLLLLCNVACLAVLTYWGVLELQAQMGLFHAQIIHLHEVFLLCTVVIDVFATSAIVWQIRRNCITRQRLHFATRIVVDSGLSYTLTSLMYLCAMSVGDAPVSLQLPRMIVHAFRFPVAAITHNVILIRVAHHRADENVGPSPPLEFIGDNLLTGSVSQSCSV